MSGYDCTQAMRRLETEVRKQKDIRETARASGDNALVKKCNERIKAYKAKYTEISNITGIPEEPKRMSKPRMPKTDNNITSPTSKVLTNSGNGGIMRLSAEGTVPENGVDNQNQLKVDIEAVKIQEERIKSDLGISIVDLDELQNADVLTEFLDETEKMQLKLGKKYSAIIASPNLKGTGTICEVTPSMHLVINPEYFNDRKPLLETLKSMSNSGLIPKDCGNIKYISKHEFYHMYTKFDIDNPMSRARVLYLREYKKLFKGIISKNATIDPYEFVSDYLSSPQQNKIKDELLKYYGLEEV